MRPRELGVTVAVALDCRNHGFLLEWEKGLGEWVADDLGTVSTGQGHECTFGFCFVLFFLLSFFFSFPPLGFHGEEAGGVCF